MAVSTPCAPPARLTAGDSWSWEIADPAEYPSAEFILSYALAPVAGGAVVAVEAEAPSPVAVAFRLGATATASLAPGRWRWSLFAADAALDLRETIASGVLEVLANPLATGDTRSPARRILDAIDATIAGKVTKDSQSYAIEGRTISRIPLPDLMAARTRYAAIVRREERRGPITYRRMRFADDV